MSASSTSTSTDRGRGRRGRACRRRGQPGRRLPPEPGLRVFPGAALGRQVEGQEAAARFPVEGPLVGSVSDVVQEFTAAVAAHGEDFIAVAWALGLDGYLRRRRRRRAARRARRAARCPGTP
ncbi:MAG: hypothetical protein WKF58_09600 [Ilumatobacteraceae bacterium]